MKHISIDVADDQKTEKLINLLSVLDFVDKIQIDDQIQSPADALFYDPRQPLMEQEVSTFEQLHTALVKQYLGEYVAIHQGQVVDHDSDEAALVGRIEAAYPNAVVLG